MKNVLYVISISLLFLNCNSQTKKEENAEAPASRKALINKEYDSVAKARYTAAKRYNDSLAVVMQWQPVNKDSLLWRSKNGDLGFPTASFRPPDHEIAFYMTHFNDGKQTEFKDVIDAATYKLISGGGYGYGAYFRDKRNIYNYWGNSDGGGFDIVDADYKTFENLSDCYARDKNYIYDLRFGKIEEIDAKTFVLIDAEKCIGRDKNGYYQRNDLLTKERLKDDPETRAIINKDKKRNHKKS
ncbi:MAG: DKNYY domain-containing protein [Flavobacterium sp.]